MAELERLLPPGAFIVGMSPLDGEGVLVQGVQGVPETEPQAASSSDSPPEEPPSYDEPEIRGVSPDVFKTFDWVLPIMSLNLEHLVHMLEHDVPDPFPFGLGNPRVNISWLCVGFDMASSPRFAA